MSQSNGHKRTSKKLTKATLDLISKREELNRIINKTEEQKREHREIRKLTRKEIRKDVDNYDEQKN